VTTAALPTATEWLAANKPDENLIWKNGCAEQVIFVRDVLHPLLVPRYSSRKEYPVLVPSTHHSKSVKLPVFELTTPDFWEGDGYGLSVQLRLRYNFFNWVVSVESKRFGGVADRFRDLFDREARVQSVYAEGFREEWVYGPYADDRKKFTLNLHDKYDLFTFVWLMRAPS